MNPIGLMLGGLALAAAHHGTWAQNVHVPQGAPVPPASLESTPPPTHTRDLKNNQFHERGRELHHRAEELQKQTETSRIPTPRTTPSP
jgi:hypothetical protein